MALRAMLAQQRHHGVVEVGLGGAEDGAGGQQGQEGGLHRGAAQRANTMQQAAPAATDCFVSVRRPVAGSTR